LVLGGAGAVGNAWEIDLVAGRFGAGVNLTETDLTIATSTAAAQITSGTSPSDLHAAVSGVGTEPSTRFGGDRRGIRAVKESDRTDRGVC
jgi:NTE family protein